MHTRTCARALRTSPTQVFAMLDADGSGVVTISELSRRMDCRHYPDVIARKKEPQQIVQV
jgi:hypothetical protein